MIAKIFSKDPLCLIIAGVGGQGNVVLSHILGDALVGQGYVVTIGETYGASQRGGSVMSHMAISKRSEHAPLIAEGHADIIVGMEPMETLRTLKKYGNPGVVTIVNLRPIISVDITSGSNQYPDLEKLISVIKGLSAKNWVVDATGKAQKLGNPILANTILLGAVIGSGVLPLDRESLVTILQKRFKDRYEDNMVAFQIGMELATSV